MIKKIITFLIIVLLLYGCKGILQESGFLTSLLGSSETELEIPQLKPTTKFENDIFTFLILYDGNKNQGILTNKDYELGQKLITLRQFMMSRRDIVNVNYYYNNNDRNLIVSVYTTLQPPGNRDQSKKWVYDKRYLFNVLTKSKESSLNTRLKRIQNYGCNLSKNIAYGHTFDITIEAISTTGITKSRNCTKMAKVGEWVLYDDHSYKQRKYKQRKYKQRKYKQRKYKQKRPTLVVRKYNNSTLITNVPIVNKPKPTTKMLKVIMKRKIIQQLKENHKNGKVENVDDIIQNTFNNIMKEHNAGHINISITKDSPAVITYGTSKRNNFGSPPIEETHDIFW